MNLDPEWVALLKILLAMILGGVTGYERTIADKPAGLRTHMLVGGAATLLVILGRTIIEVFSQTLSSQNISSDPLRVIEAIIVGISFLGAGTIFRRESTEQIEGLTTAASILFTAGIGIAIAMEQIILAVGATVMTLLVIRVLGWFEGRYLGK